MHLCRINNTRFEAQLKKKWMPEVRLLNAWRLKSRPLISILLLMQVFQYQGKNTGVKNNV